MDSNKQMAAGEPAFILESEINNYRAEIGGDPVIAAQEQAANDEKHAREVAVQTQKSAFDTGAEEYAELLEGVIGPGFAVLAPAWGVSPGQVSALAGAYGPLLQKYFPDGPSKFGPEIGAALVTLAVMRPLIGKPRYIIEVPREAANDPVHTKSVDDAETPESIGQGAGDTLEDSGVDPGEYGE